MPTETCVPTPQPAENGGLPNTLLQDAAQPLVLTAGGLIAADTYQRMDADGPLPAGDVLLTVAQLDRLPAVVGKKGLLLTVDDAPESLTLPLDQLDLIAIEFKGFGDGRGYSHATLLRRAGYRGELRAVGDVFKDVLYYLKRCGFDSFVLKEGQDVQEAIKGLHTFTAGYQRATATPQVHFQGGRGL